MCSKRALKSKFHVEKHSGRLVDAERDLRTVSQAFERECEAKAELREVLPPGLEVDLLRDDCTLTVAAPAPAWAAQQP